MLTIQCCEFCFILRKGMTIIDALCALMVRNLSQWYYTLKDKLLCFFATQKNGQEEKINESNNLEKTENKPVMLKKRWTIS